MPKIEKISTSSSSYKIIADLTKNSFLGNVRHADKDANDAIQQIRYSHVYEFAKDLYVGKEDILREKAIQMYQEVGFILPFPSTTFLFRSKTVLNVAAMDMTGKELSLTLLVYDPTDPGWGNPFSLSLDCSPGGEGSVPTFTTFTQMTSDDNDAELNECVSQSIDLYLSPVLALLSEKSDTVWVKPAPWVHVENVQLKSYERPPPSVSVVYVNTKRILHPPISDDGSGLTLRPHDRAGHWRRHGNKRIEVRPCKVNGGAPEPVPKVAKLQSPIRSPVSVEPPQLTTFNLKSLW